MCTPTYAYAWRCWAGQGNVSQHTYGCEHAGFIHYPTGAGIQIVGVLNSQLAQPPNIQKNRQYVRVYFNILLISKRNFFICIFLIWPPSSIRSSSSNAANNSPSMQLARKLSEGSLNDSIHSHTCACKVAHATQTSFNNKNKGILKCGWGWVVVRSRKCV